MTAPTLKPDFSDTGMLPPTAPLDRELYYLRSNLILILNAPPGTFTLEGAFTLLERISAALRSLIYLVRTHESLQAAGEPLALELETALEHLAADLAAMGVE